ncbi:MAG TPA: hypothetical protein VFT60_11920 [Bryobacteraceae bacterium]|nr:hypothetical protein [Bryobacteraceae bacterium]
MNTSKQQYLDTIRSNSAYPTYRGVIGLIGFIFFAIAGVSAIGAVIGGLAAMSQSFITGLATLVLGLLFAALFYLFGKLYKEAALVLVDMGDSIIDSNSHARQAAATTGS